MAYDINFPPACVTTRVGANGGAIWLYNSTDAATVVRVDGYITNGQDLGIEVGDLVIQLDHSGNAVAHFYTVNSLSASDRSIDLSDGLAIPVTDTD